MRSKLLGLAILASSLGQAACGAEQPAGNSLAAIERATAQKEVVMQVRIRAGKTVLIARLEDSAAARDFAALLPLQLTLKDYASTEKVADLPRKLSTEGAPAGVVPELGDIAYYAPWGNLALYYRDFGYSSGLVRLGRIESGIEALGSLDGQATIEAVKRDSQ